MKRLLVVLMLLPTVMVGQITSGVVSEAEGPMTITTGSIVLTRPSNATAYTANDFVASSTTAASNFFWRMPTAKKRGYLTNLMLFVDTAEVATFRYWVFTDTTNWVKLADNAVFTLLGPDSNWVGYVGYIDINVAPEGTGSTASFGQDGGIGMAFVAPDRNLYGLLQVKTAYTPKNGGVFRLKYRLFQ